METSERNARSLLAPLRDLEPPDSSGVSMPEAMRIGRRRSRLRRAAGTGAVVAAVIAVAATSLVGRSLTGPDGFRENATPEQATFDIWRRAFDVGSAGGFTPVRYETDRHWQRIHLRPDGPGGTTTSTPATPRSSLGSDAEAVVTMHSRGRGVEPAGEPAPEVNGRKAIWTSNEDLAWEWTRGAWGYVDVSGSGTSRPIAHRVAQSVLPSQGSPITFPFTIPRSAIDGSYEVTGVATSMIGKAGPPRMVTVLFGQRDGGGPLSVSVRRPPLRDAPNTTISGKPALVTDKKVVILDAGHEHSVIAVGVGNTSAGLRKVAAAVRLVDEPGDTRSWIKNPLR